MLLLIDGDILIYQAIASAEQELEFSEDLFVIHTNMADAKDAFISSLQTILTESNLGEYCLCLSDPWENWRKGVYPEYKSNRKKTRKPLAFYAFRKWVERSYKTFSKPSLEADDVIGILATKPKNEAIIWSKDKDLNQIPGGHLKDGFILEVTKEEGDYFHLTQTLTGDPVDGYPGCPGIGKVKAERLLLDADMKTRLSGSLDEWRWLHIVKAYEKAGLTEADALVQAQIARICQWENWDQTNQKVIPWTP